MTNAPNFLLFITFLSWLIVPTFVAAQDAPAPSPTTDVLVETLEDPESLARLIEALKSSSASSVEASNADGLPRTPATQVAETTQRILDEFFESSTRVFNDLARFTSLPELLTPERVAKIRAEILPLLLTIVVTVALYRILRFLTGRLRPAQPFDGMNGAAKVGAFAAQVVLRLLSVVVAWLFGYVLATAAFSAGKLVLSQVLYLNAFLIFGLVSSAISVFSSDDPRDMSLSRLSEKAEKVVYRSTRRVVGLWIYGLVAAAPISLHWVNFVLARSMRTLVVTLGTLVALAAIVRVYRVLHRERDTTILSDEISESSISADMVSSRVSFGQIIWPWVAAIYVLVTYLVALATPNQMLELVGRATLLTTIGLGVFLVGQRLLSQANQNHRITLSETVRRALPPLEDRLSSFLPTGMLVAGGFLFVIAGGIILDGWRFFDVWGWLKGPGQPMAWRVAYMIVGVMFLVVIWSVLTSWIDTRLSEELSGKAVSSRSRTLLALFKNVVSIAFIIFGGMTILSELGIDIAPLLAGAGVLGLAIGFGAQKLVQDIITGIFIQLENAINEGDVVTVAGVTGGVEKLTIRSVGLRDVAGTYHLIPFSSVDTVANFMRRFAFHVEVVGIAYDSDLEAAKSAMHRAYDTLMSGPMARDIIAPLEWHGVVGLGDSSVNLRARIKTRAGQQWVVGRAYTEQVKYELDAGGVEIPFPHRELRMPKELIERLAPKSDADEGK